jgi:5-carboxymethyl-2-hydroxymuconate isomerase
MGWSKLKGQGLVAREGSYPMGSLRVNENCFIRKDHKCEKIFGASKSCFIACPTQEDIEPILALISEKLTKVGVEPIIAVKERAYGQDVFCTKICGKIIESKFCLVILDDMIKGDENIPNPNVYYEYGLMTALNKHIIPLQKEGLTLAFNIQSYDTIKYAPRNIAEELDRAIRDAIRVGESKDRVTEKAVLSERSILRNFELADFEATSDNWRFADVIADTGFIGFRYTIGDGFYVYLGKIDSLEDIETYLEDLNIVAFRTEKEFQLTLSEIKALQKSEDSLPEISGVIGASVRNRTRLETLRKFIRIAKRAEHMYVGFLINPTLDEAGFLEKAKTLLSKYPRFEVVCDDEEGITFGEIRVNLHANS